ncbi:hypothetical protein Val02_27010 [Virgisporangium aliadipatigenens]|uniref:Uncharacterized protein n=1 Tax=Virgisporangium aliadipatigenens TaxID=741659 RepID=A0A8J3YKU0_9ACTN|nr:hypothetical protein [Virgisporangium aliadipatigenens]GIJ45815.1 hypothetical protein Val02_27010 [Virgisporangium aliadipatigenens]
MKIDGQVEPILRKLFAGAVRRDPEQITTQIQALGSDDAVRKAVELAIAVTGYVLLDVHGGKPTDEQLRVIADDMARIEEWAGFSAEEIGTFLSRVVAGEPLAGALPQDTATMLTFIVPGVLLSGFRTKPENWWDYLDRAEAAIERG